jgi:hypothetical protein
LQMMKDSDSENIHLKSVDHKGLRFLNYAKAYTGREYCVL